MRAKSVSFVLLSERDCEEFGIYSTTHTVIYCAVCPMICLYLTKCANDVWSLMILDTCLHHNSDIVRCFVWHGIKCTPDISFIGRNMKLCSDRYRFRRNSTTADKPRDAFRGQSMTPNIEPLHMWGMVSCALVTFFVFKKCRDLENRVKGPWGSLKMSPFGTEPMTSY